MKSAFLLGLMAPTLAVLDTASWVMVGGFAAVLLWWAWPKIQPLLSRVIPASNPESGVIAAESACIQAVRVLVKHGHDRTALEKLWGEIFAKEFPAP